MKKIAAITLAALLARGVKIVRSTILYSGPTPKKAHKTDAGYDLYAGHNVELSPGEHKLVSTGTSIALPMGWEAQIRPRSGLATKHGVTVLNTPGTIDAGYRGEIKVNLINHGVEKITLHKGERIAQLVPRKLDKPFFVQVTTLPDITDRGTCGHGSTGR